ncbi:hypothetical protein SBOR_7258 [Sclerotinia borealis F-4128]|uniref:Uncharacterized protein n=1 Tax=Sclerotinia borealis (strain F-4128) TaxID=1432307 RepID=W9C982_SCLBF|nr:hypothetical protein SBOR_7258 [Sclerotinia borealis F-4128]
MDHDTEPLQVVSYAEIKRECLPSSEPKEKPSMLFHSPSHDPTLAPPPLSPYPRESDTFDSSSITPTYRSTPSFPVDRFAIATRTDSLASGFPFHQRLFDFRVTHDEWHLFTGEIVQAANLSLQEDWAAWTAGISTGVLSTSILVFGGPVAGYYTGRSVHRKKVIEKVKEGLMHQGNIRATLHEWNEQTFRDKGFQAWLELPVMKGEINGEETDEKEKSKKSKKDKKEKAKEQSRFRILIIPTSAPMGRLMGNDPSSWNLADNPSSQRAGIAEAPDSQPRMAEMA